MRTPAESHFASQWMRNSRRTLIGPPASRQLIQAAQNVVPVAITAGDKIEGLRQWASGRCLSADRAGVYSRSEGVSGGRVRRVVREPGGELMRLRANPLLAAWTLESGLYCPSCRPCAAVARSGRG